MKTAQEGRIREWRGWKLHECAELGSTNDYARELDAWEAVRARRQTGARGRHGRKWESGEGGLWLSAVLPLDPPDRGWPAFPLAAGLAVVSTLRGLGLTGARLRWPNDVLVGPKKICGILMERFTAGRVVVGLGLNVTNNPAASDPDLATIATSLAAELPLAPPLEDLYHDLLVALRVLHGRVAEDGFATLADEINRHWGGTRVVELHLADEVIRGPFLGIDTRGDLLVEIDGHPVSHSAAHARLMREV
ncbi:MAG: biotin--[acetyl-CoA-carboxylase] ligase [Chthoniobacterales bacterium]|jgi:BirA family biotin operon repressor/biotin-[acetyl-CoA-carboxylase] ligase